MKYLHLLALTSFVFLSGCGQSDLPADHATADGAPAVAEISEAMAPAEAAPADATPEDKSSWGGGVLVDSSRQFIRRADIKFGVKDLAKTCFAIENIVRRQGGFAEMSDLQNSVASTLSMPISSDSTLVTTLYTMTCSMTLRVPAMKLDSTLNLLLGYSEFLNFRTVTTTDVAIDLLAQRLAGNRNSKYEALSLASGKKGSVDNALQMAINADQSKLNRLRLNDMINYSTIYLNIYQRESAQRDIIANTSNLKGYEPSFGKKAADSFLLGASALQTLVLFFIRIWWVLLLAGSIAVLVIIYTRKAKRS